MCSQTHPRLASNYCRSPDNPVQPDGSDRQAQASDCGTYEMRLGSRVTTESLDYRANQLLDKRYLNHQSQLCGMLS